MVPLLSVMDVAPVTAVITADSPQPWCVAGEELLTVTFGGRLSTMEKFVRFVSAGAEMRILSREFSPANMISGENDLLAPMPAPGRYTHTRAEAGRPFVMPWSVTSVRSGMVFV